MRQNQYEESYLRLGNRVPHLDMLHNNLADGYKVVLFLLWVFLHLTYCIKGNYNGIILSSCIV